MTRQERKDTAQLKKTQKLDDQKKKFLEQHVKDTQGKKK